MKLSITGPVHHVGVVETIGQKGFLKRLFVIKSGSDEWPQYPSFELHKEATENAPEVGQVVTVEFWLQGREWQGRWFNSAKCASWKPAVATGKPDAKPPAQKPAPSANPAAALGLDEDAEIPF